MNAQVTALVLSFNRTRFIAEALASVAAQEDADWGLLLSDCSDDPKAVSEIEAIFEAFQARHPGRNCRLLRHPERMKQQLHLSRALESVETPYVALLDDDDYWLPGHLRRALDWLESDARNGLCIANARVVDAEGAPRGELHDAAKRLPPPDDRAALMEFFLRSFYGSTSGFVMRTGVADGWPIPCSLVDIHLAFASAANGARCRCFREFGYAYREHGGSYYQKGAEIHRERHRWRLHLARRHGWTVVKRCPRFALLWIKSLCHLATKRGGSHH